MVAHLQHIEDVQKRLKDEPEHYGLPDDYAKLTKSGRKQARRSVLQSWYDPRVPHELCTDTEAFVRAGMLWSDYYYKLDEITQPIYQFPDPQHKWDMLRMVMSPPRVSTEPAKSVVHAPRGSGKTVTLIREMVPLVAISRPHSQILISERTSTRTQEEMREIRTIMEENRLIHDDFGGKGDLFPSNRYSGQRWNDEVMAFYAGASHRSSVLGYSCGTSQRGRHPILGIIDDPEENEDVRNRNFKEEFLGWLFSSYMGMFGPGCKVLWIGTTIDPDACLTLALQGAEGSGVEEDDDALEADDRFQDWNARRISLIQYDKNGDPFSIFPEKYSVEAYENMIKTRGLARASAEYQGKPMRSGAQVFHRDQWHHGYMLCANNGRYSDITAKRYVYDKGKSEVIDYEVWRSGLRTFCACDVAGSDSRRADFSASVVVGIDHDGIVWVCDAIVRQMPVDAYIAATFKMCEYWRCEKMSFEKNALHQIVIQLATKFGDELKGKGRHAPKIEGISNTANMGSKEQRIIGTLLPLFQYREIRFPHTDRQPVADPFGHEHTSLDTPSRRYFRELIREVDGFTDAGASGKDDAIDALHMAVRLAGKRRPKTESERDPNSTILDAAAEFGFPVDRQSIPMEAWTPEMIREAQHIPSTDELPGFEDYAESLIGW